MSIFDDFSAIGARLTEIEKRPTPAAAEPTCEAGEDGGWEMYGTGHGDPHFANTRSASIRRAYHHHDVGADV